MRARPFLLLVPLLLTTGCGVDSTRAMWSHPWTERHDSALAYQTRHVAEISGKTLLTPATAVVDVMTDPVTWVCILEVSRVALEACAETACACH